ncbi:thiol reductant ABC exporter subunit CydD [Dactylosporangium roseum]|uniref:Thiol reductant ABC exporter subunit CydD n=1 Tax=Dactylosporangium roseum TaxID=47989 RepID=A0ABY5YX75_9ACTN|nr:thiol reductant ABC exporter subunit CydD [Dactylosporangium roseum]UWZ33463.1 thiol reductant ABC exporter subunit CydD [Dactylosporangium roseum]
MSRTARGPVDPRLLRHARTSRAGIAVLTVIGAAQAVATIVLAVVVAGVVVALAGTRAGAGTGAPAPLLLAALAGVFAARAALTWAEQVVGQRTAAAVTDELRRSVLHAALRRGPAWVAGFGAGRLAAVLTGGLDALRPWFSGYLPSLVVGAALPLLVVVTMLVVDPMSAVIVLVTLPLVPLLGALVGWATQRRARERWQAAARLAGHFLDAVRGIATLRLFGRAERQAGVVEQMTDRHRGATVRVLRVAFLSSTALDLVGTLSVGLVAVEAGLRVAAGRLDLGPALLVILLAPEAYRPLREVAARFHASADAGAVIADVDEILLPAGGGPDPADAPGATADRPAVAATGVRVRHAGAVVDALRLPALTVHGGEFVALRGPSGAGKTTALRVLAGLQPVLAGTVVVTGGRPLYQSQDPTLPHVRSVAEALTLDGEPRPDDQTLVEALRTVGLDAEIAALPDGLDTPLGERGQGLSSGQRQRLALARLLRQARTGPCVVLLDEPTAHLDAGAEQLVVARLRAMADRGCAVLVVAHRPAVLAAVDRSVPVEPPAETRPVTAPGPARTGAGEPAADDRGTAGGRIVRLARALGRRPATAVALGAASWLAGITLTGAAVWLLVRASSLPPVLTLSTAVVLVRASAVARPLLRYLERLVSHEVGFARLGVWRAKVYADLVPRVPGPALRRRGDLLTRVVDDVDARVNGVLRGQLPAVAAWVAITVTVAAAAVVAPAVAAVLVAGLAVAGVVAPRLAARHTARADAATGRARAELHDAVVETVEGVEDLAPRDTTAALAVPDRRSRALARLEAGSAATAGAAAALAQLGWGTAVVGVALAAATGPFHAELAAVLLLGAVALAEPVLTLPDAAVARRGAAGARRRLEAIAAEPCPAAPATPATPATANPRAEAPPTSCVDVTVSGLTAGWDPHRDPALRDVDLDLPAGRRVAVLGVSGSGKSTLAAVLVRLLAPRQGHVRLGGADLRALPDATVRRHVGLVGDAADHVFATTVRHNLRLARPSATDDELRAALARAHLGPWLDTLPAGLDTWLGEGGTTVSGGQRRRLAMARALLADPALLVLDEPTEGLDEPAAAALMADLLAAASGRTVLLLTHRRDGLEHVDELYDLVDGRLVRRPLAAPASGGPGSRALAR